jgi:hypothetical protein
LEPFKAHFESLPFCGRVEMLLVDNTTLSCATKGVILKRERKREQYSVECSARAAYMGVVVHQCVAEFLGNYCRKKARDLSPSLPFLGLPSNSKT